MNCKNIYRQVKTKLTEEYNKSLNDLGEVIENPSKMQPK